MVEIGAGTLSTLGSGGAAAPLGWTAITHGMDHFVTGMAQVFTGKHFETNTSLALQAMGLSQRAAGFIDAGLGLGL